MYELIILHISASKKSAVVKITKDFGFVTSTVAQGFISLNKTAKVGDKLELPASTNISTIERTTTNEETGEITKFTWVVLD